MPSVHVEQREDGNVRLVLREAMTTGGDRWAELSPEEAAALAEELTTAAAGGGGDSK